MKITRTISIPSPREGVAIMNARTVYTAKTGTALYQEYPELVASDTFGNVFRRTSGDNGKTWSEPAPAFVPEETPEGVLREGEGTLLLDAKRNILLRFFNYHLYPGGVHTMDVVRLTQIFFQFSRDGVSFEKAKQLIVEGFSPEKWAKDVEYGVNSIMLSFCSPFFDSEGRIILPATWIPSLEHAHPDNYRVLPMQTLCLIGIPHENGEIRWEASERVQVDPLLSSRGLCEPAIAELKDGRFIMIARGSNIYLKDTPGRKWRAISGDRGKTWSAAEPLEMNDGEKIFSPATGSQLIRHSRTGTLYWIGNIVSCMTDGNAPRHPLSIARVDEKTGTLIRDSVAIIDQRGAEDTESVQFSNFRTYEDRVTGEFVLLMARVFERSTTELTSPAYEYRFIPET